MADLSTLARPYAKAVFELARDEQRFSDWSGILGGLAAAVSDPEVSAMIGHPSIGRGQVGTLLVQAIGASLSAEGRNLVMLLSDYNRLKAAPAIAREFEQLRREHEQRADVEITTAAAVDKPQQDVLSSAIARRLSREVVMHWKIDPELVAGAIIRSGDLVIDGSVRGELEKMHTALAR